jgi:hypothetical protein
LTKNSPIERAFFSQKIEFDLRVIDLLHLHFRKTDQLLAYFISSLNEDNYGFSTNLNDRPTSQYFSNF